MKTISILEEVYSSNCMFIVLVDPGGHVIEHSTILYDNTVLL